MPPLPHAAALLAALPYHALVLDASGTVLAASGPAPAPLAGPPAGPCLPGAPFLARWGMVAGRLGDASTVPALREVLAGTRPELVFEYRWPEREGTSWRLRARPWHEGTERGALVLHEPVPVDPDLQFLEEQLRQAQRMEAVGRLASGVAHDFNNLLTAILGYVQLLRLALPADDACVPYVGEINKASTRAAGLVRQLLAFAQRQMQQPQVLDVGEVAQALDGMLRRLIGENIVLETRAAPDLWPVRVDPGQLEQVLVNLVVNARDAMPQGGRLEVSVANVRLDAGAVWQFVDLAPGEYIRLDVRDTGVGLTPEVLPRLFQPFYSTKPGEEGTGLGLVTCYGIVKQAGGDIRVESAPGQGSTFTVVLPRASDAEAAEVALARPASREQPAGSGTILVVEDEPGVRKITVRLLKDLGFTVLEAGSGEEALRVAGLHPGPIRLLVTDAVMPRMTGEQTAARLRQSRPDLRVLYMSGYSQSTGGEGPSGGFLPKPFTAEALARKVREALGEPD